MDSKFCEYENRHMSCKRDWCEYTCPVVRYMNWMAGEQTKSRHSALIYREMPDEVKRAILSEALGEDVDVVQGKVKYLRKQAESNDSVDAFKDFIEVE